MSGAYKIASNLIGALGFVGRKMWIKVPAALLTGCAPLFFLIAFFILKQL